MKAINIHTGRTVPIMNNNIDTDQIIPKGFLKKIEKKGFGINLFDEWRYLDDRSDNMDFILNKPERKGASILVSGENFGCGSSREHAAWALQDYGFDVVIAGGYSDIFYMNALKNGLLPIVLTKQERKALSTIDASEEITINLEKQEVISSVGTFKFDIDKMWKEKLQKGLDDIAITLQYEKYIDEYEKNRD